MQSWNNKLSLAKVQDFKNHNDKKLQEIKW